MDQKVIDAAARLRKACQTIRDKNPGRTSEVENRGPAHNPGAIKRALLVPVMSDDVLAVAGAVDHEHAKDLHAGATGAKAIGKPNEPQFNYLACIEKLLELFDKQAASALPLTPVGTHD